MSELFDSLNLSNTAGPSSSQQSSSQPSTSKVFWHASPSPGVLKQLASWTPSKSQESPTIPLCTQAFVGELKKLPGAIEAQSPLIGRNSSKRKTFGGAHANSNSTTGKNKTREYIDLDLSDDGEEGSGPKRLLLGDAGESSPESRQRRTMDAGHTGRFREVSSSSEQGSNWRAALAQLPALDRDAHPASSRRSERRPPRRRKKESFVAGLGFTEESSRGSDSLRLFEDLQAAIQGMHAQRPSTSGSDSVSTPTDHSRTVNFEQSNGEGGRLTPREGIERTTSAPTPSRPVQRRDAVPLSTHQEPRAGSLHSGRSFRPVKSDYDVFRSTAQVGHTVIRPLQPRIINGPSESSSPSHVEVGREEAGDPKPSQPSQYSQLRVLHADNLSQGQPPRSQEATESMVPITRPAAPSTTGQPIAASEAAKDPVASAPTSPVKRSARIEAMQHSNSTKKLGVRGPSLLSKAASPSPRKSTNAPTSARKVGASAARTRTHPLPGMSQARQVGLPRSSSQYLASQSQAVGAAPSGPAAPFRPPAIARTPNVIRTNAAETEQPRERKAGPMASSDDSFADEDDEALLAFVAMAYEMEHESAASLSPFGIF